MKAFDPNYKLLDEMYQDDYYQNDEIMEETQWLEQLRKMTQEP